MNTKDDNLPAIVAIITGVVFVLISVTIAMTTSVGAKEQSSQAEDQRTCDSVIFNQTLRPGDEGSAVLALQKFLNTDPYTRLTRTGSGSRGTETGFYGSSTTRSVKRFQEKHLGSVSIDEGVWGLQTRLQAKKLCENNETQTSADEPDYNFRDYRELENQIEDGDNYFQDRITKRDRLFGGEAVLSDFDLSGWGNIRVGEIDDVASISFDVKSSDVLVSQADVSFVHTSENGDDEPWEVIESVSITSSGDTLATVSADSRSDWLDDGSDYDGDLDADEKFTIRLKGLDEIINRGDTADLSVDITIQDSVYDAGDTSWGVFIDDGGIKLVDAISVQHQIGDKSETVEFTVDERYAFWENPRIVVDESYHSPDSSIILVDRTSDSGPFNIFAFDIDTRDTDARINKIDLQMEIKGVRDSSPDLTSYNDVVDKAVIKIGDQIFTVDSMRSVAKRSGITSTELTFAINEDITIEEYDGKTARLLIRFKGMQGNYEEGLLLRGMVADGGITSDNLESEDGVAGSWHMLRP